MMFNTLMEIVSFLEMEELRKIIQSFKEIMDITAAETESAKMEVFWLILFNFTDLGKIWDSFIYSVSLVSNQIIFERWHAVNQSKNCIAPLLYHIDCLEIIFRIRIMCMLLEGKVMDDLAQMVYYAG